MKKSEFLRKISGFVEKDLEFEQDSELLKITADSREVKDGTVFFCEKGLNADGHDFIDMVLEKGAELVIGEKNIKNDRYIKVSSVKKILKTILPQFYEYPDKKIKMIGITGTNGKTSISLMLESILKDHFNCGVTGTLGYSFGNKTISASNTTPVNWKWYDLLDEIHQSGVELLISEVSSHALTEERIEKTVFDVGIFTNLSRDHLDFHKDIEDYYLAKKKLFTEHLKEDALAVINTDDPYGKRLYSEICQSVRTCRISEVDNSAQMKFKILSSDSLGSEVLLEAQNLIIKVPLVGKYNVYNALCSIAVALEFVDKGRIGDNLLKNVVIPGRLEKIGTSNVFVDYAHTPDALENVLKTLNEITGNGVITIFGAGGDRDRGKRSEMGKVVTEHSKISIITDDNPRTEDPDRIVEDILQGCNTQRSVVKVIRDRSAAIKKAMELSEEGDLILVAGKGAENYQITNKGKIYFSDKDEVEKHIREL